MSRQFEVYLLPTDVERVVAELRRQVGIKILRPSSLTLSPIEVETPFEREPVPSGRAEDRRRIDCYLAPPQGAEIKMRYLRERSQWSVAMESEVIEFSGCDFDGQILVRGRFYFQSDMLVADTIVPKRQEFIEWADRVFRTAKKMLRRSKELDAYIGPEAEAWRQKGGVLADPFFPFVRVFPQGQGRC